MLKKTNEESNIVKPAVSAKRDAFKITYIYFLIGSLWILLSDKLVEFVIKDQSIMVFISIVKGWFYVFITSILIFVLIFNKIKKVIDSENKIRESERILRESQRVAHIGSYQNDLITNTWTSSEETDRIYGIDETYFRTLDNWVNIVHPNSREKLFKYVSSVYSERKRFDYEYKIIRINDGKERWIHGLGELEFDNQGNAVKMIGTIQDITERKKSEQEIIYLSYHDQLTGLYNRRFYEEELKRIDIEENLPITIVMGDVNGLKLINDSFGHALGDELLKKAAEIITKGCKEDDIIARLGGDEFVIILPKKDANEAKQIIKDINDLSLKEKIESIDISISFGYETKSNSEEKIEIILKNAEDYMYKKKLFESPSMRGKAINSILKTLNEKSKRQEQHSFRVSELCKSMGEALGLSEYKIEELRSLGLIHDIGKIAIDEDLLNKSSKLTEQEWESIKRHSEIGYRILSTVNDMSEISEYVLAHHEKWDGTGYPKGLKGKEIPLQSRIIAIADAYDAMTNERSYLGALSEKIAIEELQKNSGTQFEPELVSIFIEKVLG